MARHHYVPQFLLRRWATQGRFVAYYFELKASRWIENAKATVASACQIPDLNVLFGAQESQRDFPETGFFTPRVDTPAAKALDVMLTKGIRALTANQRIDWARLLVSFPVRTPEALRVMGPQETKKAFELVKASAKGAPADEDKVNSIIQANMPLLERNFPLDAAMDISVDPEKLATVAGMTWWIRRWPRPAILIGDRPLLTSPRAQRPCGMPLDDPSLLIALPLAPNAVFFASANSRMKVKMTKRSPNKIAFVTNEEMIWRSSCVYFRDRSLATFATPRIEGKANGTWQPSAV